MSDRVVFAVIVGLVVIAVVGLGGLIAVDLDQDRTPVALISLTGSVVASLVAALSAYNGWRNGQKVDQVKHLVNGTMQENLDRLARTVDALQRRARETDHPEGP